MQQKTLNNRYELEQKIGEGGMARVYRGRDLRLNRLVAVKVLHPHYATDASFLSRFEHEAQAAANLRHPNIVDVYDVGQDGDIHYIVMEYVEGRDLKQLILQQGALPIDQAVAIALAVADGLDAAHRIGLIHRDIKPQNIIIGQDGQVKITDFGIAKSNVSTSATETGVIFGTADYLSPEQASGERATTSSDLYALGVTLYEMLTGRLPFAGESSIAVAMQHLSAEPPPPRSFNPRIPPQLDALVLRTLSKDPAQRPASAREFMQLLRSYRSFNEQETIVRPLGPRPAQMPRPTTRPNPRPNTQVSAPLPLPRAVAAPPQESRGSALGSFLLGLLLLAGVLGFVYLFATGTFDGLWSFTTSAQQKPTAAAQPTAAQPTAAQPTAAQPTALALARVPNIVGQQELEARAALERLKLVPQRGAERNDDAPQGQIIAQTPPANIDLAEGMSVTYTLSLGPKPPEVVDVPDVARTQQAVAQRTLENIGFKVAVETVSDDLERGFVVRQEPRAGLRVARGEQITIFVSDGNMAQMPDVLSLTEAQARQKIEAAGLTVERVDYQTCGEQIPFDVCAKYGPGTVVSFEPSTGKVVRRGTGVIMGVRKPE